MDQNVRASNRQAIDGFHAAADESNEPARDPAAPGSAMVIVLGCVALASMGFGFVLGLLF